MPESRKNPGFKIVPAFLLLLLMATGVYAQTPYGNNKAAGRYQATRGIRLYYESYGKGEPLLLLHINGGSINVFSGQIPFFAKNYRVIAVDSRAHGKTTDPADSLTFEMMADDVNALLDSLHIKSCPVIGWSDGGITGLVLAMRHPEKVKKLVVSGPNLWPDTTALIPFVYDYLQRTADSLAKLPPTAANKNQLKVIRLDLLEPHLTLQQLEAIKCPTLVIGGDHDGIPVTHLVDIYRHIPQAYLWIVPSASHFIATTKKDQFNARVAEFLREPYKNIEGMNVLQ
ncbi:alpha/beta fold hydrolase [Chitinophaga nivalis]|uniref:Alpha/beta hydrolase n=1 Tax=Chitinophaga nivalis TaxID=2991709 RepID=A0ABT3IJB4_9BACT|nr:alpha/beta hydrolase [Chitinophaga nivalis]MCW3466254.1 alpha/beta hydrolase [Chitinophaga nivalis]MCW3484055.1 alpha/beta hydrolase [Chitinophaga nivalis]